MATMAIKTYSTKMGFGRALPLLLAVLFLGWMPSPALAAAPDCKLVQLASLDLMQNARPVVEISIAGKPYHFLIDTGGFASEIDADVAQQLGLELKDIEGVEIYDVAGGVAKHYANVDNVVIGGLHADQIKMVVRDRDPDAPAIDGVLGPDILSQYDLDFDFAKRKFGLFSPDHCPGQVVYWTTDYATASFEKSDGHIVVPMTLDGHDIYATLDTGATNTLIAEHVARTTYGLTDGAPGVEKNEHPAPGEIIVSRYRFKSLSVGGLAVNNPLIYILPELMAEAFRHKHADKFESDPIYGTQLNTASLVLGVNVLSKLHIFISYKEDKLYLSAAGPR